MKVIEVNGLSMGGGGGEGDLRFGNLPSHFKNQKLVIYGIVLHSCCNHQKLAPLTMSNSPN